MWQSLILLNEPDLSTLSYDANGNMISDIDLVNSNSNRTLIYGAFEKPISIKKGSSNASQITFKYGSSRERYRRIDNVYEGSTAVTIETTYLGGYEKIVHTGGAKDGDIEHKYMLGGVALKIDTEKSDGGVTSKTRYLHTDHIGSVIAITDENANEVARFRYDPFGKQHTVVNQSPTQQTPVTKWLEDTQRGFTGHEMLSSVDVIHMNGRTYDANIGRFMQADPYIQAPKNMQSMNRYAYVLNNPLSYTDPSGYFFKGLFRAISKSGLGPVISMALFLVPGCQTGLCSGAFNAAMTYAVTGSLRNAAVGLIAGMAMPGGGSWQTVLVSGVIGGVSAKIQGGNFGRAFVAAGIGAAIGGGRGISNPVEKVIVAVVVGGTISAVSGGKFANGAVTAAFSAAVSNNSAKTVPKDKNGVNSGKQKVIVNVSETETVRNSVYQYLEKLEVEENIDQSSLLEAQLEVLDVSLQTNITQIDINLTNMNLRILYSQRQTALAMYNVLKYGSLVTGFGIFGSVSNLELAGTSAYEIYNGGLSAKTGTNMMLTLHGTLLEIGAKGATPVKIINFVVDESVNFIWDDKKQ